LVLRFGLLLAGTQAILHMPRMEDPSVTIRTGIVAAYYPGATSDQVESQLAKKIEDRLFKFAEVQKEKTYSTSRPGVLVVNVELQDNVKNSDQFWAKLRHDLSEARTEGEFPSGVIGPIVDSDFGDTVALLVAVHGNRYGYQELKEYAERIEDELRTIPDVAKLHRYGEQTEQMTCATLTSRPTSRDSACRFVPPPTWSRSGRLRGSSKETACRRLPSGFFRHRHITVPRSSPRSMRK
jgi:multidrug efflux pump subunit AcrB